MITKEWKPDVPKDKDSITISFCQAGGVRQSFIATPGDAWKYSYKYENEPVPEDKKLPSGDDIWLEELGGDGYIPSYKITVEKMYDLEYDNDSQTFDLLQDDDFIESADTKTEGTPSDSQKRDPDNLPETDNNVLETEGGEGSVLESSAVLEEMTSENDPASSTVAEGTTSESNTEADENTEDTTQESSTEADENTEDTTQESNTAVDEITSEKNDEAEKNTEETILGNSTIPENTIPENGDVVSHRRNGIIYIGSVWREVNPITQNADTSITEEINTDKEIPSSETDEGEDESQQSSAESDSEGSDGEESSAESDSEGSDGEESSAESDSEGSNGEESSAESDSEGNDEEQSTDKPEESSVQKTESSAVTSGVSNPKTLAFNKSRSTAPEKKSNSWENVTGEFTITLTDKVQEEIKSGNYDEFKIELYRDGAKIKEVSFKKDSEKFSQVWDKLKVYKKKPSDKDAGEYTYSIKLYFARTVAKEGKFSLPEDPDYVKVAVTNTKPDEPDPKTGELKIEKTLSGNDLTEADKEIKFVFTIALTEEGKPHKGTYSSSRSKDGEEPVEEKITFDDQGKTTLNLMDGESVIIKGLPVGVSYKVTEDEDKAKGFESDHKDGVSGAITATPSSAAFVNTKIPSLTVEKKWKDASGKDLLPEAIQNDPIQVRLLRKIKNDGNDSWTGAESVAVVDLGKENGWSYTWKDLLVTDGNGQFYTYRAEEIQTSDEYQVSYKVTVPADYKDSYDKDGVTLESATEHGILITVTNTKKSPETETTTTPPSTPRLPDPGDPDSPNRVTVTDGDVPKTYKKVWNPDQQTFEYILDEEVPMDLMLPKTGDNSKGILWAILWAAALAGLYILYQTRPGKRDE